MWVEIWRLELTLDGVQEVRTCSRWSSGGQNSLQIKFQRLESTLDGVLEIGTPGRLIRGVGTSSLPPFLYLVNHCYPMSSSLFYNYMTSIFGPPRQGRGPTILLYNTGTPYPSQQLVLHVYQLYFISSHLFSKLTLDLCFFFSSQFFNFQHIFSVLIQIRLWTN